MRGGLKSAVDRRVLPGSTDYYVHDEDGRPVFRVPVTSHDSLSAWLQPIAKRLRDGLGDDERILLAFDRGGAFSAQLAELRDAGIEFVTYERAPYPKIAPTAFDPDQVTAHIAHGELTIRIAKTARAKPRRIKLTSGLAAKVKGLLSSDRDRSAA